MTPTRQARRKTGRSSYEIVLVILVASAAIAMMPGVAMAQTYNQPERPTCPPGSVLDDGGNCVPVQSGNIPACPDGTVVDSDGDCVPAGPDSNEDCPAGTIEVVDGSCRPPCPEGMGTAPDGSCVLLDPTEPGGNGRPDDEVAPDFVDRCEDDPDHRLCVDDDVFGGSLGDRETTAAAAEPGSAAVLPLTGAGLTGLLGVALVLIVGGRGLMKARRER